MVNPLYTETEALKMILTYAHLHSALDRFRKKMNHETKSELETAIQEFATIPVGMRVKLYQETRRDLWEAAKIRLDQYHEAHAHLK